MRMNTVVMVTNKHHVLSERDNYYRSRDEIRLAKHWIVLDDDRIQTNSLNKNATCKYCL